MQEQRSGVARELYAILEPTLLEVYSRRKDRSYLGCVTDLNNLPQVQSERFRALLEAFPELVSIIPKIMDQQPNSDAEKNNYSVNEQQTPIQLVRLPSIRNNYGSETTESSAPIEIIVWHFYQLIDLAYSWQSVEESFFSELDNSMKKSEDEWYLDDGWLNFKIEENCELIKWARLLQVVNKSVKLYVFPKETWLLVDKKLIDRYKYKNSVKKMKNGKKNKFIFSVK